MSGDYEIVRHPLDKVHNTLVLKKVAQDETFLVEMARSKKHVDEAAALRKVLIRLARSGLEWGFDSGTIKTLKGITADVLICEVKVKRKVYRIMAYLHNKEKGPLVLLFPFHGHVQKAAGGIPQTTIDKAERLARVAKELIEAELN